MDVKGADQTEHFRRAVQQLQHQLVDERKRHQETRERELDRLEQRQRENLQKLEEEHADALRSVGERSHQTHEATKKEYMAQVEDLKSQMYNMKGQLSDQVPSKIYEKTLENYVEAADKERAEARTQRENQQKLSEQRYKDYITEQNRGLEKIQREQQASVVDQTDRLHKVREEDVKARKAMQEEFDQNVTALREDNRRTTARLQKEHEVAAARTAEIQRQKDQGDTRVSDAVKAKETSLGSEIQRLIGTHQKDQKFLKDTNERQRAEFHAAKDQLERTQEARVSHLIQDDRELLRESLARQAETLGQAHKNVLETKNNDLKALERALVTYKTDESPGAVNPAAEARMQKQFFLANQASLDAAQQSHQTQMDRIVERYKEPYEKGQADLQTQETRIRQELEEDRMRERTTYQHALQDLESKSSEQQRLTEFYAEKAKLEELRRFSRVYDRQKQNFEREVTRLEEQSGIKIEALREQMNQQAVDAKKTLNSRENTLRINYEQKLADQQAAYEEKFEVLKDKSLRESQDSERNHKSQSDAMKRSFESQLAQMKEQSRVREAHIIKNHEEELARVKQSYEAINQRKG